MDGAGANALNDARDPKWESLTEEEQAALRTVMARAKEVEQQEQRRLDCLRQPLEGQLSKWTNVVKGWQSRWFYLDPTASVLYYYTSEGRKRGSPRGSIMLDGAVIAPSDDDSQSFAISATNGETFRLKAVDAKERQSWVMRLRRVIEQLKPQINTHSAKGVYASGATSVGGLAGWQDEPHIRKAHVQDKVSPGTLLRSRSGSGSGVFTKRVSVSTFNTQRNSFTRTTSYQGSSIQRDRKVSFTNDIAGVGEVLHIAETQYLALKEALDGFDGTNEDSIDPYSDKDLLCLKALSQATLGALSHCYDLMAMQSQQQAQQLSTARALPPGATIQWLQTDSGPSSAPPSPTLSGSETPHRSAEHSPQRFVDQFGNEALNADHNTDDYLYGDKRDEDLEIESDKERKSVVLQLLSQLKLGMDLSKVVLPTFILETRSLLEMYGDFLSRPEMFASIADGQTAEDRMVRVVKFFLTSFGAGRRSYAARKPYNPIIGEFFECSYRADTSRLSVEQSSDVTSALDSSDGSAVDVKFTAEQVSHHPPVSALYVECPSKKIQMNGDVWTKTRFLGMAIGVHLEGEVCISVLKYDEEYKFTLPSAFARSILTVPWIELGGRVNIICEKTGYQSSITFHTKPLYGGKPHKISGEISHISSQTPLYKITGEWNDKITMAFDGKDPILLNAAAPTVRPSVRPVHEQGELESRRLWRHVTVALKMGDIQKATDEKKALEDGQRFEAKERQSKGIDYRPKLFHQSNQRWLYNNPLSGR